MSIRLKFCGAARTVTGSCYLLQTDEAKVIIDCGMFQGSRTERECCLPMATLITSGLFRNL